MPVLFQISYSLVPKIKIFIKYFSDKNYQKQSLCSVAIKVFSSAPNMSNSQWSQTRFGVAIEFLDLPGFRKIFLYIEKFKFRNIIRLCAIITTLFQKFWIPEFHKFLLTFLILNEAEWISKFKKKRDLYFLIG